MARTSYLSGVGAERWMNHRSVKNVDLAVGLQWVSLLGIGLSFIAILRVVREESLGVWTVPLLSSPFQWGWGYLYLRRVGGLSDPGILSRSPNIYPDLVLRQTAPSGSQSAQTPSGPSMVAARLE